MIQCQEPKPEIFAGFPLPLQTKVSPNGISQSYFLLGWNIHNTGLLVRMGYIRIQFVEEGEITLHNFAAVLIDRVREERCYVCMPQSSHFMQRPWTDEATSEPWKQNFSFDLLTVKAELFLPRSDVLLQKWIHHKIHGYLRFHWKIQDDSTFCFQVWGIQCLLIFCLYQYLWEWPRK